MVLRCLCFVEIRLGFADIFVIFCSLQINFFYYYDYALQPYAKILQFFAPI